MKQPKISIVLPTYNGERFLADSIESILAQTEKDWELIIVNDCSTDDTLKIANKYAKQDSRISVISNKTNKKLPTSLNVGFATALGKYLTWTSDDNMYHKNALGKMAHYLDTHKNTDMVSFDINFVDEDTLKIKRILSSPYFDGRHYQHLAIKCNVGAAFMYRKSIADKVGKYDETMFCAEDYDYWCRIALNGRIDYVDEVIYDYRENSQSLTATKQKMIQDRTQKIREKYYEQFCKVMTPRQILALKFEQKKFPIQISSLPMRERVFWIYMKIKNFIVRKTLAIFLCRNKKLRRKIRAKLLNIKVEW